VPRSGRARKKSSTESKERWTEAARGQKMKERRRKGEMNGGGEMRRIIKSETKAWRSQGVEEQRRLQVKE
jgi:hypothetical protein